LRYLTAVLLLLVAFSSCEDKGPNKTKVPVQKPEPIIVEFGFTLNNYQVIRDTIQSGDTFSKLLEKYYSGEMRSHDITEKIKDSINLRSIRAGRPYTILNTKTQPHKIQALIYEADNVNYFVVDFRDSLQAYKKQKPITIKRRTIASEIVGSLSETLAKAKTDPSLAHNLADIYAYSIDFFKIQKGDKVCIIEAMKLFNEIESEVSGKIVKVLVECEPLGMSGV
jgi:biotin carboxyl carrier protein